MNILCFSRLEYVSFLVRKLLITGKIVFSVGECREKRVYARSVHGTGTVLAHGQRIPFPVGSARNL